MFTADLTILSYHVFNDEPSEYRFSRTFDQFSHDIRKKVYDEIHIDDAKKCTIRACEILKSYNRRAKIFVCPSLIGTAGYCTWQDIVRLGEYHDIENHGFVHRDHSLMNYKEQQHSIATAQEVICSHVRPPRFFIPPYNQFNQNTFKICQELKLTLVHSRVNILNISK